MPLVQSAPSIGTVTRFLWAASPNIARASYQLLEPLTGQEPSDCTLRHSSPSLVGLSRVFFLTFLGTTRFGK